MKKGFLALAAILLIATFTPLISIVLKLAVVAVLAYFAKKELQNRNFVIGSLSALGALGILVSLFHTEDLLVGGTGVALAAMIYGAFHKKKVLQ